MATQYAQISDLTTVGLPPAAVSAIDSGTINSVLLDQSAVADNYFRARYGNAALPLLAPFDPAIVEAVAKMAAWRLMVRRGMKPGGPDWEIFKTGNDEAIAYLDKVQRQQAHPHVVLSGAGPFPGTPQPNLNSASVVNVATGGTAPNRGW